VFDLYLITPDGEAGRLCAMIERALTAAPPGRVAVQLRSPASRGSGRRELAHRLRTITARAGAPLLISADPELALQVSADGVQLPERGPSVTEARRILGDHGLIGASRHDLAGAQAAARAGADFLLLAPVFEVPGKGEGLGEAGLERLTAAVRAPVVALGGIGPGRVGPALHAGASAVAALRHVAGTPDPAAATAALLSEVDRVRRQIAATARSRTLGSTDE
jgi:thiamine-phosphate pyrophosphorylase